MQLRIEISRDSGNIGHTRHRTKTNKTQITTKKSKKMSNPDSTKNRGWIQMVSKRKQFLTLIRQPPCYQQLVTVLHRDYQVWSFVLVSRTRGISWWTPGCEPTSVELGFCIEWSHTFYECLLHGYVKQDV